MAATGTGRATIYGFPGGVTWTGIGTLFKQSGEAFDEAEITKLKDDMGKTRGLISNDRLFHYKLVFQPVAASGTNTIANARTSLEPPAQLAGVVLATFDWATANSSAGLKWVFVTGTWKIAGKNNGITTYELEIIASDDTSVDLAANPVSYS